MADNVLATPPKKQRERYRPELLKILDDYAARVANDFTSGLDRSAQGFGEMVDDGNYLTGVPRLALGGLQWMGSPVSAAVSPILGPVLQPVGEAVDTYVGQPVERATGYPADITNELFLTGVTAGAGPLLKPSLKGTGNFLATMGDAAEAGLNRVGYTARPQAGTFFSGGGPVKLADDEGLIAYHGSPHSFDKFDMSKMGTGEGNQAFGNGLYFAQREGTADFYRSELTDQHGTPYKVDIAGKQEENPYIVSAAVDAKNYMNNANPSETMAAFNNAMSSHKADLQEKWDRFGGQLSNPDLHPVTRKSLDELRDALNRIDSVTPENFTVTSGSKYQVKIDAAPEDIKTYSGPSGIKAKAFAEQAKREGYKGIKYLDGWSRRAGSAEGATYNYVIFDDKLITILKKYGIPMTAGAGGAMMVSGEAMPPELAAQLQGGT